MSICSGNPPHSTKVPVSIHVDELSCNNKDDPKQIDQETSLEQFYPPALSNVKSSQNDKTEPFGIEFSPDGVISTSTNTEINHPLLLDGTKSFPPRQNFTISPKSFIIELPTNSTIGLELLNLDIAKFKYLKTVELIENPNTKDGRGPHLLLEKDGRVKLRRPIMQGLTANVFAVVAKETTKSRSNLSVSYNEDIENKSAKKILFAHIKIVPTSMAVGNDEKIHKWNSTEKAQTNGSIAKPSQLGMPRISSKERKSKNFCEQLFNKIPAFFLVDIPANVPFNISIDLVQISPSLARRCSLEIFKNIDSNAKNEKTSEMQKSAKRALFFRVRENNAIGFDFSPVKKEQIPSAACFDLKCSLRYSSKNEKVKSNKSVATAKKICVLFRRKNFHMNRVHIDWPEQNYTHYFTEVCVSKFQIFSILVNHKICHLTIVNNYKELI